MFWIHNHVRIRFLFQMRLAYNHQGRQTLDTWQTETSWWCLRSPNGIGITTWNWHCIAWYYQKRFSLGTNPTNQNKMRQPPELSFSSAGADQPSILPWSHAALSNYRLHVIGTCKPLDTWDILHSNVPKKDDGQCHFPSKKFNTHLWWETIHDINIQNAKMWNTIYHPDLSRATFQAPSAPPFLPQEIWPGWTPFFTT
jgi:hypothetical protein